MNPNIVKILKVLSYILTLILGGAGAEILL